MSKRKCPDCKSTSIVYRCEICGCQWAETSPTPELNRATDPRLIEAVEKIKILRNMQIRQRTPTEWEDSPTRHIFDDILDLIYMHIPELKEADDE